MRLKNILAGRLGKKLRRSNYFNRPSLQTQTKHDSGRGLDAGSATAGGSLMTTGIPTKQRHREFLGYDTEDYDRSL